MIYKLEIINNKISNCYVYKVYKLKYKHWWSRYQDWHLIEGHTLGKNYICPEIYKKQKTVENLFNEDLESVNARYDFNETHYITVIK